jgi:hypothetical protein
MGRRLLRYEHGCDDRLHLRTARCNWFGTDVRHLSIDRGVLFLLWLVLVVVLGGIGDVAEGVFGIDIDAMGADASFKALTFQGVMAFMMFFGLTGIIVMQSGGPEFLAVIVGGASGAASMLPAKSSSSSSLSRQRGPLRLTMPVGSIGTVYLRIPKGGTGQVSVSIKGSLGCTMQSLPTDL